MLQRIPPSPASHSDPWLREHHASLLRAGWTTDRGPRFPLHCCSSRPGEPSVVLVGLKRTPDCYFPEFCSSGKGVSNLWPLTQGLVLGLGSVSTNPENPTTDRRSLPAGGGERVGPGLLTPQGTLEFHVRRESSVNFCRENVLTP